MNMEKEIQQILLDDIIPNRFQPRKYFDEKSLKELADSIKEHGIIQPLVLRKLGDKYEIIAGERRYKASIIAGRNNVPAIIVNLDDTKSAEVALAENIQRTDLTSIEEAESYQNILRISGMTQIELAAKMGKSQSYIANKLRLLELMPETKQMLLENKISERHARSLLMIKDRDTQLMMLNNIVNNRLTVRQTDEEIKNIVGTVAAPTNDNIEEIEIIEDFGGQIVQQNNNENLLNNPEIGNSYGNSDLDVEKLKNQSIDINQPKELPSFDNLLKNSDFNIPDPKPEAISSSNVELKDNPQASYNRFIPSLEDEPATMLNEFVNKPYDDVNVNSNFANNQSSMISETKSPDQPGNFMPPNLENQQNLSYSNEQLVNNSPDLRTAISLIRNNVSDMNSKGYIVETEELDLDDNYQIIIRIKK